MTASADVDEMVEACLRAGELTMASGSAELQAAMQVMLFVLGQYLAKRSAAEAERALARAGRDD